MKSLLLLVVLFSIPIVLSAQSRVSIAPTYRFDYSPYTYQVNLSFNGSTTKTPTSGYGLVSLFGLTARYHFTTKLNVSVGTLYYRNNDHIQHPQIPYGESTTFPSDGWQVPILANYRLTSQRLSPYFSTGVFFTKSKTFTERPITIDGALGIGLDYRINSGLSFLLQPTAGYSFYRPASDDFYSFTQYRAYSLGVQTQLIWHL